MSPFSPTPLVFSCQLYLKLRSRLENLIKPSASSEARLNDLIDHTTAKHGKNFCKQVLLGIIALWRLP